MRVLRYARRRTLFLPVGLLSVIVLAFLLVNALPGNPAGVIAGPAASPTELAEIERRLGLDQPLWERFVTYLDNLVRGDLGSSYYTDRPILDEILRFAPATLELVFLSLTLAALLGIGLGTLGAYRRGTVADRTSRFVVTTFQSIPDFFLALLLIYLLFYLAGWAPAPVGRLGLMDEPPPTVTGALLLDSLLSGDMGTFRSAVAHSVLPVLTLGIYYSAYFARSTYASLAPALESKQVEFARASGLRERTVLAYAFRQARTPILTYGGILLAALLGGAAIIETIFSWGGFGEWAIDSILQLDIPAVQGFILAAGLGTLLAFTALDILVAALDPRVRYD
ncbi:ABC transporter permease [Micromonospora craniellae]|uniref:ABC transporter permease n=1 Tax=Micromonospora craniellae TaxID=2294034 RepID=A0A372FTW4_9ACTN|nr:ABC transporter permease [Micromonospora craniellae]QOC92319.1 ABC transporter permease [Micromonospora craniellae]RFS44128.1 ABC transporter permease [Micromonospora craniellae]